MEKKKRVITAGTFDIHRENPIGIPRPLSWGFQPQLMSKLKIKV